MGLNLVMACHCHRVRRFVYRGHEDGGIVDFYRQHWQCNVNNPGTVVLSDDQASDSWLHDESYEQEEYGNSAAVEAAVRIELAKAALRTMGLSPEQVADIVARAEAAARTSLHSGPLPDVLDRMVGEIARRRGGQS